MKKRHYGPAPKYVQRSTPCMNCNTVGYLEQISGTREDGSVCYVRLLCPICHGNGKRYYKVPIERNVG